MKNQQLSLMGYTNVTGLACRSFGQEEMKFSVPTMYEYPSQPLYEHRSEHHISGKDFIFLLLANGKTWYKKIDLTTTSRASLYYHDGPTVVSMNSKHPDNTRGTVLAYPFDFDDTELEKRRFDPECVIEKSTDVISSAEIMLKISTVTIQNVNNFLKYLWKTESKHLLPFPNDTYLKAFGSRITQDIPLSDDQIRNLYILVIIQAQREGCFPYNLTYAEFMALVVTEPQPPFRCK